MQMPSSAGSFFAGSLFLSVKEARAPDAEEAAERREEEEERKGEEGSAKLEEWEEVL